MKVSKQQAAENRDAIIQVAATQIRERGFNQMSVAEVAKAAGLTHGALYSHFKSKEALQAAALERAFDDCAAGFAGLAPEQFLSRYLSPAHRDDVAHGCPTAALMSEMRWQSEEAKAAFHDGLIRFAALTGDSLGPSEAEEARGLALFAFAAMAGGLAIARAIRDQDEVASDAVLRAVADQLQRLVSGAARQDRSAPPG
ncbi:MAG: TetR family transcriptional regulator [Devosia sp.]|nr:TetR family transcriptional regulator [Devosia sp.]